jgi:Cytidylate kinase-like family
MTLVTISAAYGAGGSRVGPAVAERLDLPFVDRAIPTGVAERLALPLREAVARDESVGHWLTRALLSFGQVGPVLAGASPPPAELVTDDAFRTATEEVLHELAVQGAVVLGRAGALVLGDVPGALHVRLTGPRDARIAQGAELEHLDLEAAERHLEESDRAREAYVCHFYRCDPADAAHYHLVIDSTALALDACAALIADAALARSG